MKRCYLTIVDIQNPDLQNVLSICEPVNPTFVKDNALKRFGLTMSDIQIASDIVETDLETVTGKVKNSSKVITMVIF